MTSMTSMTVRRLLIDLEAPIARQWNGGDAFRSPFFNSLSMSFPARKLFFIDAVRACVKVLRWPTRRSAGAFLFGRDGLVRRARRPWLAYFRADFHPSSRVGERGVQWLRDNAVQWAPVGLAP
jgi:predicted metal-dependent hydrolase